MASASLATVSTTLLKASRLSAIVVLAWKKDPEGRDGDYPKYQAASLMAGIILGCLPQELEAVPNVGVGRAQPASTAAARRAASGSKIHFKQCGRKAASVGMPGRRSRAPERPSWSSFLAALLLTMI